ncbi:MAG: putative transposase [Rhodobacteraceae bacterium HLUCCO07]|nr:MAG: putative transposase [Rhodobacteraceae bacterium HLUCCO07]
MSDAFEDGCRFRVQNVIDDFSRECLAAVVDTSVGGARVARELDRIAAWRDDYNHRRPPSRLDGFTPREYYQRSEEDQNLAFVAQIG